MALCFRGCSKKTRDGFSNFFYSANVALAAVSICIISFAKGDACRNIEFREQIENMVLISHVIESKRVLKEENCQIYCYLEANCVSYNYGPTEDELYLCELSDKNHLQVPSDELEARHGFIYRPVTPNFCVTSPCANDSTCQTGYGEEGFRCLCPHGFHGDRCQLDIEECVTGNHNCSPNAICANVPGSFLCNCKTGYTGDGVDCTAEPPTVVACVSVTKIVDIDSYFYEVNADHGSWPANGFCRVISNVEITDSEPYILTVEIMNVNGRDGVNYGHPGVMYNVVDENNFDVVYFRPHSQGNCCQLGYVSNGTWLGSVQSSCPNGSPSGGVWFTVRVEVFLDKSVNIYLNNDLVTSPTAKFNTKGRGGVLVANGYQNIIQFRGFDINENL